MTSMAKVMKQPARDAQNNDGAGKLDEARYKQKGASKKTHFDPDEWFPLFKPSVSSSCPQKTNAIGVGN